MGASLVSRAPAGVSSMVLRPHCDRDRAAWDLERRSSLVSLRIKRPIEGGDRRGYRPVDRNRTGGTRLMAAMDRRRCPLPVLRHRQTLWYPTLRNSERRVRGGRRRCRRGGLRYAWSVADPLDRLLIRPFTGPDSWLAVATPRSGSTASFRQQPFQAGRSWFVAAAWPQSRTHSRKFRSATPAVA